MKHYIKISIIGIASIFICSCNNFLDTEPYASISESSAITNYNNAIYALTGAYNTFQETSYYGRNFVVIGDVTTNNIIVSPTNSNRFISEAQWSLNSSSGDMNGLWSTGYTIIDQANKLIAAVDNIDATDIQKASIKAQSLAIRAIAHFDLVRIFAQTYKGYESGLGIPYITKSSTFNKPARNSIEDVYQYIIQDLNDAIANFEIVSAASGDASGLSGMGLNSKMYAPYFISSWAVKGILAKVYMTQQNYNAANSILEDIINNSGYIILPTDKYVEAWSRSYDNSLNVEFMFAIRNLPDDYNATNCLGYIYIQSGYGDLRAPNTMIDLYESTDIRKGLLFVNGTEAQTGWTFVNKYPGRDGIRGLSDTPVLRLSDIYLLYAETQARVGTASVAIEYLDKIRQRADISATATPSSISNEDLINAILLERRKELAYEGQYYFDLKRLQMDVTSAYRSDYTIYQEIEFPSYKFAMPIPQAEIDANDNMVPNPISDNNQ